MRPSRLSCLNCLSRSRSRSMMFASALLLVTMAVVESAQQMCHDQGTCEHLPVEDSVSGSAMMQVKSKVAVASTPAVSPALGTFGLQAVRLKESRGCVPMALQDKHLQSLRKFATLLASRSHIPLPVPAAALVETATDFPKPAAGSNVHMQVFSLQMNQESQRVQPPPSLEDQTAAPTTTVRATTPAPTTTEAGVTAPAADGKVDCTAMSLSADGFKETTSLCCPEKMQAFFTCLLDTLGYDVCSEDHVQGLMHWFSCVPDMEFQYMLDVISDGNPCKYWSPRGQTCPALSEECIGQWCR